LEQKYFFRLIGVKVLLLLPFTQKLLTEAPVKQISSFTLSIRDLFFRLLKKSSIMRRTLFAICCLCTAFLTGTAHVAYNQEQFGKVGYYADSFQGKKTANGERYDKDALTCAHKSLPFGTKLRVTRLDNKKSVVVRVNDRGPFTEGYVVDLSRAAARQVDLIKAGVARCKIEVIEDSDASETDDLSPAQYSTLQKKTPAKTESSKIAMLKPKGGKTPERPVAYNTDEDPVPAAAAPAVNSELYKVDLKKSEKKGFGVQVGTLYDADNVLPIITKLQSQWPNKVLVSVETNEADDVSTYRVIVGPYPERKAAEAQQKSAAKKGYKKCFVVELNSL
jgi:rare lipoprotein A